MWLIRIWMILSTVELTAHHNALLALRASYVGGIAGDQVAALVKMVEDALSEESGEVVRVEAPQTCMKGIGTWNQALQMAEVVASHSAILARS